MFWNLQLALASYQNYCRFIIFSPLNVLGVLIYTQIYCSTLCIVIFIVMYHNVLMHQTSKIRLLRRSLQKSKNQFQYLVCLLDA